MNFFSERAIEAEFLDRPNIPSEDLFSNLEELDFINNYLGGHSATIKGIKFFIRKYGNIKSIIDVGCGGGDTLGAIAGWCKKHNYEIHLTGIDILPEAIEFANQKYGHFENINFISSDFRNFTHGKYDLAINSLICHHFYNLDLDNFLKFNSTISNYGFIINDLHRHPLAYYSISVLSKLFSDSYMVKNDAPLSVKKGFTKNEIKDILLKNNFKEFLISWEWAFRYLVIVENAKV